MFSLPVFVGLDYHDASVRVCVLDSDGRELANADRCNDWKAIAEFADRFGRPVRAAIESCCGASKESKARTPQATVIPCWCWRARMPTGPWARITDGAASATSKQPTGARLAPMLG